MKKHQSPRALRAPERAAAGGGESQGLPWSSRRAERKAKLTQGQSTLLRIIQHREGVGEYEAEIVCKLGCKLDRT